MSEIMQSIFLAHPFWSGVGALWVFSAAVSAMPEPNGSGNGYKWLYGFLHGLSANLKMAFGSKVPGLDQATQGEKK